MTAYKQPQPTYLHGDNNKGWIQSIYFVRVRVNDHRVARVIVSWVQVHFADIERQHTTIGIVVYYRRD